MGSVVEAAIRARAWFYPEVFTPLSFSMALEVGERATRAAISASGLITPEEMDGVPIT